MRNDLRVFSGLIKQLVPRTRFLGAMIMRDDFEPGDYSSEYGGVLMYESPHFISRESYINNLFCPSEIDSAIYYDRSNSLSSFSKNGKDIWVFNTNIVAVLSYDPLTPIGGIAFCVHLVESDSISRLHIIFSQLRVSSDFQRIGVGREIVRTAMSRIESYLGTLNSTSLIPCDKILFRCKIENDCSVCSGYGKEFFFKTLNNFANNHPLMNLVESKRANVIEIRCKKPTLVISS